MIKLQVIGHLGKDCIVNTVNGKSVINFSVAHTEKFKDATGVTKEKTIWVECAYWTERTAIAPYLKKGQLVYAEGAPDIRTYQTQDGRQGASMVLRVSSVQLLGSKTEGGSPAAYQTTPSVVSTPQVVAAPEQTPPPPMEVTEPIDDLPF